MARPPLNESQKKVTQSARESVDVVVSEGVPIETLIDRVIQSKYSHDSFLLRSKVVPVKEHSQPYIVMLNEHKVVRRTVLMFQRVTRLTYSDFLNFPANYVTLPDMMLIQVVTGVTVGRQVQLLLSGLTEYDVRHNTSKPADSIASIADL